MRAVNTEAVQAIYAGVETKLGESALLLAQLMKEAFQIGLGSEPPGNVDYDAAYDRTVEFLALAVQAGTEFDFNNGWPGFVYAIHGHSDNKAVLGDKDNDPLMYSVLALAKEFHKPVAEERQKDWFDGVIATHGHEDVMKAALRRTMMGVHMAVQNIQPTMPSEID